MALTQVVKQIANDPESLNALFTTFNDVEEIQHGGEIEPLYKTFRIQGQGMPRSDSYVTLVFERSLKGKVRVSRWYHSDKTTGL